MKKINLGVGVGSKNEKKKLFSAAHFYFQNFQNCMICTFFIFFIFFIKNKIYKKTKFLKNPTPTIFQIFIL